MDKREANKDTTYCKGENCQNKCWRHITKWKFNEDEDYWLMECCEDERSKEL